MGLGAGEWKLCTTVTQSEKRSRSHLNAQRQQEPTYVIVWLAVQNKQGEDKGMPVIWPSRLCLSFTTTSHPSARARRSLSHIPDLPVQFQPSRPIPAQSSILAEFATSEVTNHQAVSSTAVLAGRPLSRRICSSPTSDCVRAFKSITLSKSSNIDTVASEISSYIESVAREREKERERIRREREAQLSASPKAAMTPMAAPMTVPPSTNALVGTSTPAEPPLSVPHPITAGPSQPALALTPETNPAPPNTFYPSPPSTNGKPPGQSTELVATPTATSVEPPSSLPEPGTAPFSSSFDDFDNMDTSWSQPSSELMNLGMSYDMPFDVNVDAITGGGGGGSGGGSRMNLDFEDDLTFTEDDFDFFDRPSGPTRLPPVSSGIPSGAVSSVGPTVLGFSSVAQDQKNHHQIALAVVPDASPVMAAGPPDVVTPKFAEPHLNGHHLAGTVLLPSPEITPYSQFTPETPRTHQLKLISPTSIFDPIPFAHSHRLSDSKYDMGKFALPSPPDEEDRTEPIPFVSSGCASGWKARYSAATDPRVGVVRRLIGVKRKSLGQGRRRRPHLSWLHDYDDVHDNAESPFVDMDDVESDTASDSDEGEMGDMAAPSRQTTPPPAYLLLGASLLHMQFYHPCLLPLSKPLRPPGAAVAPMTIPSVMPVSVPTPVSPAAVLGAASEKTKSLEAAGSMIAREVVENCVFAKAWRASRVHVLPSRQIDVWSADVTALARIMHNLDAVEGGVELFSLLAHGMRFPYDGQKYSKAELDEGNQAGLEQKLLRRLEPPMLSVGKGDCVVQLLPSSLRFWEKLGLAPCGGKKDVTAYLVFDDGVASKQESAESWLQKMSCVYNVSLPHSMLPYTYVTLLALGSSPRLAYAGDSLSLFFRWHFSIATGFFAKVSWYVLYFVSVHSPTRLQVSFIGGLSASSNALVVYIALPDFALSLASPLLRQILSTTKRLHKSRADCPILFQLVPEVFVVAHDLGNKTADFEALSFSVYQRLARPVDRTTSRRMPGVGEETRAHFREPLFTLSRPVTPTVQFSPLGQPRSLDVLDRHTFLHIGYRFSSCGKWLLVSCVDQRGESYDIGSWLTQDEAETSAVIQVWNFAAQFAQKANIEWRLVITKLGVMSSNELDSWIHHLSATVPLCRDLPPFHITILSVDHNTHLSLLHEHLSSAGHQTPSRRPPSKDMSKAIFVDIASATTYLVHPSIRIPLPAPMARHWADSSFVPDNEGAPVSETLPLLPVSTTVLLHVPPKQAILGGAYPTLHIHLLYTLKSPGSSITTTDEITHQEISRNFHELAVLARVRNQGSDDHPLLPLHLAALETMHDALKQEDTE
ncbi:hypothetical protein ID866_1484 [Astraeus odoratus]|nr:hypothetical protein ID866_1484 [Astraeus odoratus]